jgi:hypothetical protein
MTSTIGSILAAVGVLSAPSAWALSFVTASSDDVTPPVFTTAPLVRAIPGGLMEVVWTTNEAADSRVSFGDSPALLTRVAGDIEYSLSHRVRLTGLVPNATYYYQVTSVDPTGNAASSVTGDFVAAMPSFTMTVNKAGAGSGAVGGGGTWPVNTSVAPTATAASGSTFAGWTPAGCGTAFALTGDTTCIAKFNLAADLDADSDVDDSDYAVFRAALGSCTGAARYRSAADYDHDGCVTTADYRIWYGWYRSFLARP